MSKRPQPGWPTGRNDGYHPGANPSRRGMHARRRRRLATKRRVAAMSPLRRTIRRVGVFGTWCLGFVTLLCVAALVMFYVFTDVPRPEEVALPQVATILYSDGSVLARVGTYDHTIVELADVPEPVRWSVLAAEDRNFYSDPGVSIKGTLRAVVSDVFGGDTQGGSGITQQYVKNAYVGAERNLTRKLKELMIAIKLAREYSKNEILEYYLNTVYFGRGAYGIAAAARAYFGKDVGRLSVAEGALLAALLRDPGYYDPASNKAAAVARWNYVLDGLEKIKHLTAAHRAKLSFPRVKRPKDQGLEATGWRYLVVGRVFAELAAHGVTENDVYKNGLTIRTTISRKAQSAALSAIRTNFAGLTNQQRNLKHALVAINPRNGAVLAYYGGKGNKSKWYDGKVSEFDYAYNGLRPPGSSFKPYTLAAVLSQTLKHRGPGYAINSYVRGDACLDIQGIEICNDPTVGGRSSVTIKDAMTISINTSFDWLAAKIGPKTVAALAHKVGVRETANGVKTLEDDNGDTGFGIGIGDYPVSPFDQAAGFATFANGGKRNDPYFVQSATTSQNRLYYQHKSDERRVLDPQVANDVTVSLRDVAAHSFLSLAGGRPSACKTGTTGIGKNTIDNSDAWTVGYTPQVSAAVWVGTGVNQPIKNASGGPEYGSDLPGHTWKAFMDAYLANRPYGSLASKQQIQPGEGVYSQPTYTPTPTHSSAPPTKPTSQPETSPTHPATPPTVEPTTPTQTTTPPPTPTPTQTTTQTTTPPPTPPTPGCGGPLQPPCPGPGPDPGG